MQKFLLAVTMVGALASPASADAVLTLSGPIVGNVIGPQSSSNPCIIAGQNCGNPASFGYNNFTPNGANSLDRWSTSLGGSNGVNVAEGVQGTPYNALALVNAAGGVIFDVAIDVNTNSAASETLLLFEVWNATTNTRLYHYDVPTVIGGINNNGNGWADWTLGAINLTGLGILPTDGILFHAQWNSAVAGAESFFITAGRGGIGPDPFGVVPIPGPAVGAGLPALVGALFGLLGFRHWRRRRLTA